MKQSPARVALVLLFIFIGCFGTAYAAAGMLNRAAGPGGRRDLRPEHRAPRRRSRPWPSPGPSGPAPNPRHPTPRPTSSGDLRPAVPVVGRPRGLASLGDPGGLAGGAAIGLIWVSRRSRADHDRDERIDGASDWSDTPGGGGTELVGVGAMIAAPGVPVGGWAPPGMPPAPAAPYPYPYPTAPSAPIEPTSPYGTAPAPPPYPPGTPYPAATPYPPPTPYPAVTPYPASPTVAPPDAARHHRQPPPAPADRPGDGGPVPPAPPA